MRLIDHFSLSLWTHRHGLAAVEGSDGRLGRLAAAQLYEGAALAGSVRAPAANEVYKKMFSFKITADLSIVHSSMAPNGARSCLTSSSS